jgi:speckle-type POZ protein
MVMYSHSPFPKAKPKYHLDNSSTYFQDMEKLFTSGKFCDVKIVCGKETFLCHKNILATRSEIFAAMSGSTENQTGVMFLVEDFDAKTMKTVLEYIYVNNIARKDGDMDLLLTADKYNLPGLAKCGESSIISELSLNKALEAMLSS